MELLQQNKCSIHNFPITFMQISQINHNKVFYCEDCINNDESFESKNFIKIQQIIDEDIEVYKKWPPVDCIEIKNQIAQVLKMRDTVKDTTQISLFFKKLKHEIIYKIEELEKKTLRDVEVLCDDHQTTFKKIQNKFNTNNFKEILINDHFKSNSDKEMYCLELINAFHQQKSNKQQQIQDILNQGIKNFNSVDFKILEQQKNSILSLLDEIKFYSFENPVQNQQPIQTNVKQDPQNNNLHARKMSQQNLTSISPPDQNNIQIKSPTYPSSPPGQNRNEIPKQIKSPNQQKIVKEKSEIDTPQQSNKKQPSSKQNNRQSNQSPPSTNNKQDKQQKNITQPNQNPNFEVIGKAFGDVVQQQIDNVKNLDQQNGLKFTFQVQQSIDNANILDQQNGLQFTFQQKQSI